MPTSHGLDRFLLAQNLLWHQVRTELAAGAKRSHWMWFVFPQLQGLGHSDMAKRYGIASLAEATAYTQHPVLGPRLRECCVLLLNSTITASALEIFGSPDHLKLHSSMTLFALANSAEGCYGKVLEKFYADKMDARTLQLLAK